jgi:hypothetical protein
MNTGIGVALGTGVGATLFAATDQPVWIALGAAMGAAVGVAYTRTANTDSDDESAAGNDEP